MNSKTAYEDMIKIDKAVIIPGTGINIQKLCKSKYLISLNNGSKGNVTSYSGSVLVPMSTTTEIQSFILSQGSVNNIYMELFGLAATSNESTFEEYSVTYSNIVNLQVAGSYYFVYTGDFELPIEINSFGNQLSIRIVGMNEDVNVKYNIVVKTALF